MATLLEYALMELQLRDGVWNLVLVTEHRPAQFVSLGKLSESASAPAANDATSRTRAVLELKAVTGGLRPRALLGGEFIAELGAETTFEVYYSGDLGLGVPATCPSLLDGKLLVPGLPLEFASAVLGALTGVQCMTALPAGLLRVDRSGHDEAESSQMVFEKLGGLLRCVLAAGIGRKPLDERELRYLMRDA